MKPTSLLTSGPALLLALPLSWPLTVAAQGAFRHDDPIWEDPDDLPIPKPAVIELSTTHDVIYHSFGDRGHGTHVRAMNVNTLGEVPDSSWFTNRIGVREMTLDELTRGPDTVNGPDTSGPWTVVAGKSQGITPGFTIVDARGDTYFIKFDSVGYPHLATAVDVIGTKLFHAIGYNVPENHIAHFRRSQLQVHPEARFTRGTSDRRMNDADIDSILALAPPEPDGRYRVVASRAVAGEPIGHRLFFGTRGEDANDVFPHEHRRELRGFRVFCAWLNHDDSRALNSIDVFVPDGERGHVRHYLIDFSSILGAGSDARRQIAPQSRRAGNEYIIEWAPLFKTLFSFGLWERPWRHVEHTEHPEIGRLEADFFQPQRWKPEYPNPAFRRMTMEDAFWAARIVARFDDERLRAVIATGQYADPGAERLLGNLVIARRDKVLGYYLRQLSPIDELHVEGSADDPRVEFAHLGERLGLGSVSGYDYAWARFDNLSGERTPLGTPGFEARPSLPVPEDGAEFMVVRVRGRSDEPGWALPVDVFLRQRSGETSVVGIERAATDRSLED